MTTTDLSTAEVQQRLDSCMDKGSVLDEGMYLSLCNKLKRLAEYEREHKGCEPKEGRMIVAKYTFKSRWSVPEDIGPERCIDIEWDFLKYKNTEGKWVEHHGDTATRTDIFRRPGHVFFEADMDGDLCDYYAAFDEDSDDEDSDDESTEYVDLRVVRGDLRVDRGEA